MFKSIYNFFDKLEDHIRNLLSNFPIIYAFIGGVGIVIFWRGVWHTMDFLMVLLSSYSDNPKSSIDLQNLQWWDGPLSIVLGSSILLATGVFVSNFIGNEILISGIKKEKKLSEKTEQEIRSDSKTIQEVKKELKKLSKKIDDLTKS